MMEATDMPRFSRKDPASEAGPWAQRPPHAQPAVPDPS